MKHFPTLLIRGGIFGVVLVTVLNLYAYFGAGQPAANPFHEYWWVSWFPAYLIWLVLLVAGLRGKARRDAEA
ncbi:MAG: hypothetical protein AB8B57_16795 [Congregibacter sp.]